MTESSVRLAVELLNLKQSARCWCKTPLQLLEQIRKDGSDGLSAAMPLAGSAFGKVLQDAGKGPWAANQTVTVTFQSASPRNSLGRRGSFLTVERLADGSSTGWDVVRLLLRHCLMHFDGSAPSSRCLRLHTVSLVSTAGDAGGDRQQHGDEMCMAAAAPAVVRVHSGSQLDGARRCAAGNLSAAALWGLQGHARRHQPLQRCLRLDAVLDCLCKLRYNLLDVRVTLLAAGAASPV